MANKKLTREIEIWWTNVALNRRENVDVETKRGLKNKCYFLSKLAWVDPDSINVDVRYYEGDFEYQKMLLRKHYKYNPSKNELKRFA